MKKDTDDLLEVLNIAHNTHNHPVAALISDMAQIPLSQSQTSYQHTRTPDGQPEYDKDLNDYILKNFQRLAKDHIQFILLASSSATDIAMFYNSFLSQCVQHRILMLQ